MLSTFLLWLAIVQACLCADLRPSLASEKLPESPLTRDVKFTDAESDAVVHSLDDRDKRLAGDRVLGSNEPQTRLFTDNQELNAGIGGFLIGGGVALLGAHLLSEHEKAERRKKCGYHMVKRDAEEEVQSRFLGFGNKKDDYDCPPVHHSTTSYKEPSYHHKESSYKKPTYDHHREPSYQRPSYQRPYQDTYKPPPQSSSYRPSTSSYRPPSTSYHTPSKPPPVYHDEDYYKPHYDDYRPSRPSYHDDGYRRPSSGYRNPSSSYNNKKGQYDSHRHDDGYRRPTYNDRPKHSDRPTYEDRDRPSNSYSSSSSSYRPSSSSSYRPPSSSYDRPSSSYNKPSSSYQRPSTSPSYERPEVVVSYDRDRPSSYKPLGNTYRPPYRGDVTRTSDRDQDGISLLPRTLAKNEDIEDEESKEDSSKINFGTKRSNAESSDKNEEDDKEKPSTRSGFVRFED